MADPWERPASGAGGNPWDRPAAEGQKQDLLDLPNKIMAAKTAAAADAAAQPQDAMSQLERILGVPGAATSPQDFLMKFLATAGWVLPAGRGVRPPEPSPAPQPWGTPTEPVQPPRQSVPTPVGQNPTFESVAAGDFAAQQAARDAAVNNLAESAVRNAATRSVSGYNLAAGNAARRSAASSPAGVAAREGQGAVEGALNNLMPPPPKPPGAEVIPFKPKGEGAKPPSKITPEEIKAFIETSGEGLDPMLSNRIAEDLKTALEDHAQFLGSQRGPIPTVSELSREPPVSPGMIRLYHGGLDQAGPGPRDFTTSLKYAEGYAAKSPGGTVTYIDLPKNHPLVAYDAAWGELPPSIVKNVPENLARQRQPLQAGLTAKPKVLKAKSPGKTVAKKPKAKAAPPAPPAARETYAGKASAEPAKRGDEAPISEPEIPTDSHARVWLGRAAHTLRSGHSLASLLHGNPGPLSRQAVAWMMRNYPELKGASAGTLNKIGTSLLKRLTGTGKK